LQNRSAEFVDEVITILNGRRDRPSIRALILRGISEVPLWRAVDGRVSVGEGNFEPLIQADGLPRIFPGAPVAFAIRTRHPSDFFGLVGAAQVCFDRSVSLVQQLGLRADALAALRRFSADALRVFCEFFGGMACVAGGEERSGD
jgi:hypothetical protein